METWQGGLEDENWEYTRVFQEEVAVTFVAESGMLVAGLSWVEDVSAALAVCVQHENVFRAQDWWDMLDTNSIGARRSNYIPSLLRVLVSTSIRLKLQVINETNLAQRCNRIE